MLLLFQSTHDVITPDNAEKAIELLDAHVFPGGSVQGNVNEKRYQIYTPMDEQ